MHQSPLSLTPPTNSLAAPYPQVFDTANRYHMLHSLALLGAPLCRRPGLVAALLASGILVFSGTCYYYALTGDKSVRRFTPYGGMMLIAGWLAMAL